MYEPQYIVKNELISFSMSKRGKGNKLYVVEQNSHVVGQLMQFLEVSVDVISFSSFKEKYFGLK